MEEVANKIRNAIYEELVNYGMDKKKAKKLVEECVKVVKLKKPIRIFGDENE